MTLIHYYNLNPFLVGEFQLNICLHYYLRFFKLLVCFFFVVSPQCFSIFSIAVFLIRFRNPCAFWKGVYVFLHIHLDGDSVVLY